MRVIGVLHKPIEISRKALLYSKKFFICPKSELPEKEIKEFQFYQTALEQSLIWLEKRMKHSKYSKSPEISPIEKGLVEKGVIVRFGNDLEIAKFIQKGLRDIEEAGYTLPKCLFIVPPKLIMGAGGAAIIFRKELSHQAPILLPRNIVRKSLEKISKKHKLGIYSTDNISYYIHHEVGHWLHFQNKPSYQECQRIWQKADQELIGKEVSQMALKTTDGTEFVAEVFAGLVDGKQYSEHVIDIYRQLRGPIKGL